MTIIDAHAHIGQGEMLDDPLQNGNTVEKVAGLMEQAGIARSIIFPVLYSDYSGPNQEMAELASKDKRFIGFGRIKAARADGAQQVSHAIEDLGLKGIKIHPEEGFPTREVMNAIDKLKVPVVFHSGFGTSPEVFESIATAYPKLQIIVAHIGVNFDFESRNAYGYPELAIRLASEFPNVFLDTAAVYLHRYIEKAVKALGPERIVFGSDSPDFIPAVALKHIEVLELPDSDFRKIVHDNIARILKL